jgi:hypothetical protein
MLKTNTILKITASKLATIFVLALIFFGRAEAQPTNYCNPTSPTGFTQPTYYYCWPAYYAQYYGWPAYYSVRIGEVRIETTNGALVWNNTTNPATYDDPSCFKFFNTVPAAQLDIGDTYTFKIRVANVYGFTSYYCYSNYTTYYTMRLFIDWNANGVWTDAGEWVNDPAGANPNPSWRGYYPHWNPNQSAPPDCSSNLFEYAYNVKIPDNVDATKVRMRVMTSYYYPYEVNGVYDYGWAKFYDAAKNPCVDAFAYDYYNYGYSYVYAYGETEDYVLEFQLPLQAVFPSDQAPDNILFAGELYNGQTRTMYTEDGDPYQYYFKKPFVQFKTPQAAGTSIKYEIHGPMPSTNVVYTGYDPITGSPYIDASGKTMLTISKASGIAAANNGNGDLKISSGGEYQLWITIHKPNGQEKVLIKKFTASWLNDLAVVGILSPQTNGSPRFYKYPPQVPIPFMATFQNVGLKNITKFKGLAKIYNSQGVLIKTITQMFDTVGGAHQVLQPTQSVTMDFGAITLDSLDTYSLVFEAQLLSAQDLEPYNNDLPRSDDPKYIFEVQAETEVAAIQILNPANASTIYAGQAIKPSALLENLGVSDVSNVTCTFTYKLLPNGPTFPPLTTVVKDVPSGYYNKQIAYFNGTIFDVPGDYSVTLTISTPGDYNLNNNTITSTFKVIGGLSGTIKVGQGQTVPDLNTFEDMLYNQGLSGDLNVELTDDVYNLYAKDLNGPAWDLSSWIMGLGYDQNTKTYHHLTFKPSAQKATQKASVVINLYTMSGKGVLFGQNRNPASPFAPVYSAPNYKILKQFINTPGYISFDGGANKSLKFVLHSYTNNQGQAFFLGRGSHDISIKNVIIENATPSIATDITLPVAQWSPSDGFKYTADSIPTPDAVYGFSAGIANRGSLTSDLFESNTLFIDTVQNSNNKFIGNEITGFGYGIATMGIGVLINPSTLMYQRYYNLNNEISDNLIYNVERAGIFLGYEENAKVSHNRIYSVKSVSTDKSYGIEAGAYPPSYGLGYNNVGLSIINNEISGVADSKEAGGINILQNGQQFPSPLGGYQFFPNTSENFKVYNNIIWGIKNTDVSGARYGINIFTDRTSTFYPKYSSYYGQNLLIANNTILLEDDGINNAGNQAGICILNFSGVQLYNNAIAITDNAVNNSSSDYDAAIVYEGRFPSPSTFVSDHNAFWLGTNPNLSHFRFVESYNNDQTLEVGYNNQYKSLLQWQMWTKNDSNSVTGINFVNDLTKNTDLPQYLRVKSNPTPLGSVLNNRGLRIDAITTDIDGNVRGDGGYPYDIGADEFQGRMYVRDLQPLYIVTPGNYEQTAPRQFSDAEYYMTEAPVDIVARIHNPGSMLAVGVPMHLTIDVQKDDGSYETIFTKDRNIDRIESFEFQNFSFATASGQGQDFVPATYYELNQQGFNYNVPQQFKAMQENVTPIYRITVRADNDLNNDNNTTIKYVRFYVKKSNYAMMVNTPSDLSPMPSNPNVNDIASRLNYQALQKGLAIIGFEKVPDSSRFDFDYFNRLAWEPRAIDYTMFRTMFWSDGDNEVVMEPFDRYQDNAVINYLNSGISGAKKNLILASQEYPRVSVGTDLANTLATYFRVTDRTPSNPLGANGNYNGYTVKGLGIARNLVETIQSTDYPTDDYPKPAYLNMITTSDGLAQIAYTYQTLGSFAPADAPNTDRIMGVVTATFNYNTVFFGIDWRHFASLTNPMRGILDFAQQYDGNILPVNLLSFNAEQAGNRVDINWATGSEYNTSLFEVERADVSNNSMANFSKIAAVKAAGVSGDIVNYGPISDSKVQFGNTYAYRLKMVDKDGSYSYSDIKKVTIAGLNGTISMSDVTPSPAQSTANVHLDIFGSMNVDLSVYDLDGRKVMTVLNGMQNNSQDLSINVSNLLSGTYTLILRSGDVVITKTFTVVR